MCHPIGFVFFWMHQKSKNTTLVSSYWICFLGSPIGFAFLEAPKKQKHNPCALLLDLFFLKAPKKQKHNPCALLLDLLFWQPPKSKNTTLMPSYWICFFGSPKKTKTKPLCPLIAFAFFGSPKKAKKTGALVLDVLFRKPQKRKSTTLMQSTNTTLVLSCWICFFGSLEKRKQPPRPGPPDATCPWHES